MTRVEVSTGIPFDEFRSAFEKAAPAFDFEAAYRIVARGGDWAAVRAAAEANAPTGLMVYWTIDALPLMADDLDGDVVFSIDKPSTPFGSLGVEAITAVGQDLDRQVAALLRVIGVDADAAFATG
jgi:hypothetical protein